MTGILNLSVASAFVFGAAASAYSAPTIYTLAGDLSSTYGQLGTPFSFQVSSPEVLTSTTYEPNLTVLAPGIDDGPIVLPAGTALTAIQAGGNTRGTYEVSYFGTLTSPAHPNENVNESFNVYFTPQVDGSFTMGSNAGQLQTLFYNQTTGALDSYAIGFITNASLTTPEPASLSLVGLATLGLLRRARRRG